MRLGFLPFRSALCSGSFAVPHREMAAGCHPLLDAPRRSLVPATKIPVIGWFGGYYDPKHFRRCSTFVGVTKDIAAHMVRKGIAPDRAHFIPTFPDIAALPPADRVSLATPRDVKVLLALVDGCIPKKDLIRFFNPYRNCPIAMLGSRAKALCGANWKRRQIPSVSSTGSVSLAGGRTAPRF